MRKTLILMMIFGILCLSSSIVNANDIMLSCDPVQFGIILAFMVFMLFFIIGYHSPKPSGGFFLLLAGFAFIGFSILAVSYLSIWYSSLLIPYGLFICLLGVKKAFYET